MDKELFSNDKNSDESSDSNNEELEKDSKVTLSDGLKEYTSRIIKIQRFIKTVNPSVLRKESLKNKISVPELYSSLNDLLLKHKECPDEKEIEENIGTLVDNLDKEIENIKVSINIQILM